MNSSNPKPLRLAILCGGRSAEHEISLISARSVLQVISRSRYAITVIGISRGGYWIADPRFEEILLQGLEALEDTHPLVQPHKGRLPAEVLEVLRKQDVVFPLLHGPFGEDGTVQGFLELEGIPYVGSGVAASAVAMDKVLTKNILQAHGIPVVPHVVLYEVDHRQAPEQSLQKVQTRLSLPVFVKPANLGSSIGITKVKNWAALLDALDLAFQYDTKVLVEQGVPAREIEVSVLGNEQPEATIPGEIRPSREFYDYEAKYLDDRSELLIPAPLDERQVQIFQDLAVRAYRAIDAAGMARIDFLLDRETGEVFVNEINTIPGFTPISMYPKLWEASGLAYPDLIDRLIDLALARARTRSQKSVVWKPSP